MSKKDKAMERAGQDRLALLLEQLDQTVQCMDRATEILDSVPEDVELSRTEERRLEDFRFKAKALRRGIGRILNPDF